MNVLCILKLWKRLMFALEIFRMESVQSKHQENIPKANVAVETQTELLEIVGNVQAKEQVIVKAAKKNTSVYPFVLTVFFKYKCCYYG